MIQVSIGRRSRSPFSPLSLRMMSREDLMMADRDWDEDCEGVFVWRGIVGLLFCQVGLIGQEQFRNFNFCADDLFLSGLFFVFGQTIQNLHCHANIIDFL